MRGTFQRVSLGILLFLSRCSGVVVPPALESSTADLDNSGGLFTVSWDAIDTAVFYTASISHAAASGDCHTQEVGPTVTVYSEGGKTHYRANFDKTDVERLLPGKVFLRGRVCAYNEFNDVVESISAVVFFIPDYVNDLASSINLTLASRRGIMFFGVDERGPSINDFFYKFSATKPDQETELSQAITGWKICLNLFIQNNGSVHGQPIDTISPNLAVVATPTYSSTGETCFIVAQGESSIHDQQLFTNLIPIPTVGVDQYAVARVFAILTNPITHQQTLRLAQRIDGIRRAFFSLDLGEIFELPP